VLEQIIREIQIRCEPREIPDSLESMFRISTCTTCCTFRIFQVSPRVEILTDADQVIATVGIVKEEVAPACPVEGEEPAEPEVIGKGKKEDEGDES
jgi:large subunit ribosomal protein L25